MGNGYQTHHCIIPDGTRVHIFLTTASVVYITIGGRMSWKFGPSFQNNRRKV